MRRSRVEIMRALLKFRDIPLIYEGAERPLRGRRRETKEGGDRYGEAKIAHQWGRWI